MHMLHHASLKQIASAALAGVVLSSSLLTINPISSLASETVANVPLYTKRSPDLTAYADINRGFKMLR